RMEFSMMGRKRAGAGRVLSFVLMIGLVVLQSHVHASKLNDGPPHKRLTQDEVEVKGKVTDADNVPLVGVSVSVKGAADVATSTDANGEYLITVPSNGTLRFSYIGFETKEVKVGGQTTHHVTLETSSGELEE